MPSGPVPAPRVSRSQDMRDPRSSRGVVFSIFRSAPAAGCLVRQAHHVGALVPLRPGSCASGRLGPGRRRGLLGPLVPAAAGLPSGSLVFQGTVVPVRYGSGFRVPASAGRLWRSRPWREAVLHRAVLLNIEYGRQKPTGPLVHPDVIVALAVLRACYGPVKHFPAAIPPFSCTRPRPPDYCLNQDFRD